MCAPPSLSGAMEASAISRFNSQSSNRTFASSDNGNVSPLMSPLGSTDGSVQTPFLQTSDNKEWIDLNILSPKLVENLRRQYDPSISNEPSGALGKGAAKLKAFVRQTKRGIDIRLRRKVNADQDEITDISLIPDSTFQVSPFGDTKFGFAAELPTAQNEISELPDSSVRQELDSTQARSRLSIGSSINEPLPRYEPRTEAYGFSTSTIDNANNARSIEQVLETPFSSAAGQIGANATPPEELSLPNSEHSYATISSEGNLHTRTEDQYARDSPVVLDEKLQIPERLQTIISSMQDNIVPGEDQPAVIQNDGNESMFGPFRVAKKTVYETETDAEPLPPIRRKYGKSNGKKVVVSPKRRKSNTKATPRTLSSVESPKDSDEEVEPDTLLRKRTIPKRLPANSGAELLWSSLLRTQSKLLGAEHPLVYKAKSDFAHSRANSHSQGSNDLSSLTKSKAIAAETLGLVHPWVAAFAEELETLESLIKNNQKTDTDYSSYGEKLNISEPANLEAAQGSSMKRSQSNLEQPGISPNSNNIQDHAETALVSGQDATRSPLAGGTPRGIGTDATLSTGNESVSEVLKPALSTIRTSLPAEQETSSVQSSMPHPLDSFWNTGRAPHQHRNDRLSLPALAFDALIKNTINAMHWLQRRYGPEPPVEPGKVRVRWTCSCGEQLYDDFIERRRGAARELEAYLNRPKRQTAGSGESPTSPSGSSGFHSHGNSSVGWPPSYQTSWSSYGAQGQSTGGNGDSKNLQTSSSLPLHSQYGPFHEPPWLLTCVNEDRYTPKMDHLNMAPHRIMSDRDLAEALREHYFTVNKRWWRKLRIRGLVSIEFIQLEVHQNRFADIRKCPDMPDVSREDYTFEPIDLLPPVGSQYLVHLFKHPQDYEGECITYLRAPKKRGHLYIGVGWGINLVEGFLAHRVWMFVSGFFALGSLAFLIAWQLKRHNVQGASGVAAWIVSVGVLAMGWVQASLG